MMPNQPPQTEQEIQQAFLEYDRDVTIKNFKVACVLGAILMPVGAMLDRYVYPEQLNYFIKLRLVSSVLIGIFYGILLTAFGRRHYRIQGVLLFMIPAGFISWMIYKTEGAISPYYAGLNLVLLVLAFVLHWTFRESITATALIVGMYIAASFGHGSISHEATGIFFNNLYFLVLTGIIVSTGSFFNSRLRFREFALRHELAASQKTLQQTNEKLVELGQVKDRFFANISHELRTPLTLLLSPLETMLNSPAATFDAPTKNLLGIMHSNGMRLLKLINDLLDLVRLESGRMEVRREPMEMTAFIRGITNAAQQMAENKNVRLEIFVEPDFGAVLVDRDKLEKVVLNLVFNALKFTPKNGRVELRVIKAGTDFVITVADTGIGIAAKHLPYIFDRFWQADGSSKRKFQGVGIGLSLVKELTELHGGTVAVESQEGVGTKFTVRIPLLRADAEEAAARGNELPVSTVSSPVAAGDKQSEEWLANLYRRAELFPAVSAQEKSEPQTISNQTNLPIILIADDEPDMLRFLRSQLQNSFQIMEAADGQEALEKAAASTPDIVLLDMNMPRKDGLQVCRELREQSATKTVPVVMLTARADEQTKLSALSAGANDFLAKPFSTIELNVRIRNLLERHVYEEKLAEKNELLEQTIEQLKQTELQLVQTEKMVSLGRMSAGIIHEINNPLNYASTGLYTLRKKGALLPAEQQAQFSEVLTDVEDGINRVKNIVLDLRKFSHTEREQIGLVEVAPVVHSAVRFLGDEWKDHVEINVKLREGQTVYASQNRLLQVFINLLQNAIDSVKEKKFSDGEKATVEISGRIENGKSIVTIRDNGKGIEQKDMVKIFDPFFTTKDVGAGMGLGLSICYQLIQDSGGKILVASEPGKFAEFSLEFPEKLPPQTAELV